MRVCVCVYVYMRESFRMVNDILMSYSDCIACLYLYLYRPQNELGLYQIHPFINILSG